MKLIRLPHFIGLISVIYALTACTGSNAPEQSNIEVLETQQVFAKDTLLASSLDPSGVVGFDDSNRPIMNSETMSCPTDGSGGTDNGNEGGTDDGSTGSGGSTGGEETGGGAVVDDDGSGNDDGGSTSPGDNTNPGGGTVVDDDDNTTPPPPSCEDGFMYNGTQCVSICRDDQIFAQGQCYDREVRCDVANGDGIQRWLANTYGHCQVTQCDSGYQLKDDQCVKVCKDDEILSNGQCKPVVAECKHEGRTGVKIWLDNGYGKCHASKNCNMPDGKGMKRYNKQTLLYDSCEVSTCNPGFKASDDNKKCESTCASGEVHDGHKCLPEKKECEIAGGTGEKVWNHKKQRYGWCEVVSCDRGFIRTGNACRRPNDRGGDGDPLVVDLGSDISNAQGIRLSSQLEGILFDILGLNSLPNPFAKKQISWTQDQRYQWVVKPNSNGQVLGINEMFGDNTLGPDGQFSKEGFEALGKYDADKNGLIDSEDPIYNELALWHDANRNGVSDAGELTTFAAAGISYIDLNYDPNFYEVDQYGNKTTFKSIVRFNDGRRSLIFDLWFRYLEPTPEDNGGDGSEGGSGTPTDPGQCPVPTTPDNF